MINEFKMAFQDPYILYLLFQLSALIVITCFLLIFFFIDEYIYERTSKYFFRKDIY